MRVARHDIGSIGFALAVCVLAAGAASAQQPPSKPAAKPATPSTPSRVGVHGFGTAGIDWVVANDSFEALGLDSSPVEVGGGVQVSGLWRDLFLQVTVSRWSTDGERAFVDDDGNVFPLGIPLDVRASYVDVTAGWKFISPRARGRQTLVPYVGAGGGLIDYSERSPFARPGDDLDRRTYSIHFAGGVEVPITKWLGIGGDFRYRLVPDLLGDGGASAALNEKQFDTFQAAVSLRIGYNSVAAARPRPPLPPRAAEKPPEQPPHVQPPVVEAVLIEAAPVFLLPDTTRTPLRILARGTYVRVLEDQGEWLRVEFPDSQFGPRVGYVEKRHVR
jgi:hypothetical protein